MIQYGVKMNKKKTCRKFDRSHSGITVNLFRCIDSVSLTTLSAVRATTNASEW